MSSSRWIFAIALAAAGCNPVFGNEATVLDTDLDGVRDTLDNCPTRPNPDQADSDGDGTGDACGCSLGVDTDGDGIDDGCDPCVGPGPTGMDVGGDGIDDGCELCATANGRDIDHDHIDDGCDACPAGPNHDEDGDGVFDDCDVCPGLADPAQALTGDFDNLGDVCDPSAFFNYTLVFDSFERQNTAYWPSLATWSIAGDELRVSAAAAQAKPRLASTVATTPTNIIEARISGIDPSVQSGIGIRSPTLLVQCTTSQNTLAIAVVTQSGQTTGKGTGILDVTKPLRLRLRTHTNFGGPASNWIFSCEAIDDTGNTLMIVQTQLQILTLPDGGAGTVEMISVGGATSFQYLWVVVPDDSAGI